MHSYLRAIGFDNIKKRTEVIPYIKMTIEDPDIRSTFSDESTGSFVELKKEFGKRMGLAVCGNYDDDGSFVMEYYYPYFRGVEISSEDKVEIEKHNDKNSYAAVCDDMRLGVALIYYLQNICEYKRAYLDGRVITWHSTLSALSFAGRILLPRAKKEKRMELVHTENIYRRYKLIDAAKYGDDSAVESLTLNDIDSYANAVKRIATEDLFSIVDTSIMPYGVESDVYTVVAEITGIDKTVNVITKEEIYLLAVEAKGINFEVCIRKSDLLGVPEIGRRFRGLIWMQGYVTTTEDVY